MTAFWLLDLIVVLYGSTLCFFGVFVLIKRLEFKKIKNLGNSVKCQQEIDMASRFACYNFAQLHLHEQMDILLDDYRVYWYAFFCFIDTSFSLIF
jgi:hypothetical protein